MAGIRHARCSATVNAPRVHGCVTRIETGGSYPPRYATRLGLDERVVLAQELDQPRTGLGNVVASLRAWCGYWPKLSSAQRVRHI